MVVNAFMVNMVLISVVLLLLREAWKWHKFFRLDELPEFNRSVLEGMRQALEGKIILISGANYLMEYPASFMLVVNVGPCRCSLLKTMAVSLGGGHFVSGW